MIPMNYYGKNDIPLGEFLRRYCFRDMYTCQACGIDMAHHQRHFVHRSMELRVTMQRLPAIPGYNSGSLFTWLACKQCSEVCNSVTSHSFVKMALSSQILIPSLSLFQSTPLLPMAEDSLCLSFAKFLELKFYGSAYGVHLHSNNTCSHPLHTNYIQYFCYQEKVAAFE